MDSDPKFIPDRRVEIMEYRIVGITYEEAVVGKECIGSFDAKRKTNSATTSSPFNNPFGIRMWSKTIG
ncbi:MAG: hypothetical protein VYC70_07205 [Verrucomicrobiota bacterium]|nr:hypothetical protein [Verrucomicrobiota bacterium]